MIYFMNICPVTDYTNKMLRKSVATRDVYEQRSATFQSAMKLSIAIGKYFGLNPVIGVSDIDATKVR